MRQIGKGSNAPAEQLTRGNAGYRTERTLETMEARQLWAAAAALRSAKSNSPDPRNDLFDRFNSRGGQNYQYVDNPALDKLTSTGMASTSPVDPRLQVWVDCQPQLRVAMPRNVASGK